jgi:hypothetical protein
MYAHGARAVGPAKHTRPARGLMRCVPGVSQNCAFDSKISRDRSLRMRGRGRDARAPLFGHRHKRRLNKYRRRCRESVHNAIKRTTGRGRADARRQRAHSAGRARARLADARRDQLARADGRGRGLDLVRGRHDDRGRGSAAAALLDAGYADLRSAAGRPVGGAHGDAPRLRRRAVMVRGRRPTRWAATSAVRGRSVQVVACLAQERTIRICFSN